MASANLPLMTSANTTQEIRVYGYRWVVLLSFVFGGFMTQVFWICYAPITKVVAHLFRLEERATIVGLGGMAIIFGIVVGQIATPFMLEAWGLRNTMLIYGIAGVVSALVFLIFAKDHPPTPAGHEERVLMLDGLKHIFTMRDFYLLAFIAFVINAIFNGISTWVEVFVRPKGLDINQAGLIGGLLLIGGILGFLIFPFTSDRTRKRKPVIMVGALLSLPFLVLLANVDSFALLAIVSVLLGICVMGIWPVTLQYSTEICYPAPEGTSMGMISLAGQISVLAVTAMGWSNEVYGSFTPSLLAFAVSMAVVVVFVSIMKESKLIQAAQQTEGTKAES